MKAATAAAQPRTAGGAMKAAMAAVRPKRLQSVGSQRGQWFDAWVAMARPRKEKEPATDAATGEPDEYVTLSMSELKKDSSAATVALGLVFGYLALGVAFYSQNTDWSVLECFYFVVVTLSSVGFGDLTPQTDAMRLFTGAYILVTLTLTLSLTVTLTLILTLTRWAWASSVRRSERSSPACSTPTTRRRRAG